MKSQSLQKLAPFRASARVSIQRQRRPAFACSLPPAPALPSAPFVALSQRVDLDEPAVPPRPASVPTRAPRACDSARDPVRTCPWCAQQCLKDAACNHVVCGVCDTGAFCIGAGCGRSFCFHCEKKLCSRLFDPTTGTQLSGGRMQHDARCCSAEPGYVASEYCPGGHNSHCTR